VVRTVTRQLDEQRTPTVRSFHALMYDVPGDFLRRLTEAWSSIAAREARLMVELFQLRVEARGFRLEACRV